MNDDFFKQAGEVFRRNLDKLTRETFLGDLSTSSSTEPKPIDQNAVEEMERMLKELDEQRKDLLHMIVITIWAPVGAMLKCRYEEKIYLLINKLDWPKIKASIPESKPDLLGGPWMLTGIPVVEDDELARKILVAAILRSPKFLSAAGDPDKPSGAL